MREDLGSMKRLKGSRRHYLTTGRSAGSRLSKLPIATASCVHTSALDVVQGSWVTSGVACTVSKHKVRSVG